MAGEPLATNMSSVLGEGKDVSEGEVMKPEAEPRQECKAAESSGLGTMFQEQSWLYPGNTGSTELLAALLTSHPLFSDGSTMLLLFLQHEENQTLGRWGANNFSCGFRYPWQREAAHRACCELFICT